MSTTEKGRARAIAYNDGGGRDPARQMMIEQRAFVIYAQLNIKGYLPGWVIIPISVE